MNLVDSDIFSARSSLNRDMPVMAERQIKLGNLIVLRVVRIEIILSVKFADPVNLTICGKAYRERQFHNLLI